MYSYKNHIKKLRLFFIEKRVFIYSFHVITLNTQYVTHFSFYNIPLNLYYYFYNTTNNILRVLRRLRLHYNVGLRTINKIGINFNFYSL